LVELTKKLGAKPGADVLWQAVRFVYRKADRPR
jgi:hypothetical protein